MYSASGTYIRSLHQLSHLRIAHDGLDEIRVDIIGKHFTPVVEGIQRVRMSMDSTICIIYRNTDQIR